jgi:glycosyltransferase involved in cell wall biosynthesis
MKKISILMPTRNRFELAKKSIDSLFENCQSIKNFEVLLAVDYDDTETTKKLADYINNKKNIKMFFYERQFYRGLNVYINDLAQRAKGTSLMLWNDDSIIESKNWDYEILKNHETFCVLNPLVSNMEDFWKNKGVLYPIIPKKWIEITGEWSRVPACDSVIDLLAKRLGLLVKLETVSIFHDRYENTGNNHDVTYKEVTADKVNPNYVKEFHIGYPEVIEEHYNKLKYYLDSKNKI